MLKKILFISFVLLLSRNANAIERERLTKENCCDNSNIIGANVNFSKGGLEKRIEFWKLIFSKYGENDLVFHHRDYPFIIYSVLDVSHYRKNLGGYAYQKKEEEIIKKERRRIVYALNSLSSGKAPRNEFESRIKKLFDEVGGNRRKIYLDAVTDRQIRVQSGIKEKFKEGVKRSGRYMNAMEKIFRHADLPVELARIPLIESSFDYEAYSAVGAAGIWQFMRATGKSYMQIDSSIDERRDPILATRAATRYLKYAYSKLESWPLAITSYNHGISGMMKARKFAGSSDMSKIIDRYDGKTFGFASKNFYVEFVAALEIEQNYKSYFPDLVLDPESKFDEIEIGQSIFYSKLVKYSKCDETRIRNLNRSLREAILKNRVMIPRGFLFKVPKGFGKGIVNNTVGSKLLTVNNATKVFVSSIKQKQKLSSNSTNYRVQKGDSLLKISSKFNVSVDSIVRENNLKSRNSIRIGQILKINSNSSTHERKIKKSLYYVRKGDTLSGIATKHGISLGQLKSINNLKSNNIRIGQKLRVK